MKIISIMNVLCLIALMLSGCKNQEAPSLQAESAQIELTTKNTENAAAKADDQDAAKADIEDKTGQESKLCPANIDDPDGLYRDFFDCKTPFPMKNGKAAKYDKSWKEGEDGALMNGYEFHEITQEFIDNYKKALEAAGYVNDRPIEAPPMFRKFVSETSELRVELSDTLCKDWMDDCDQSKKTGNLMVQTAIMTFDL